MLLYFCWCKSNFLFSITKRKSLHYVTNRSFGLVLGFQHYKCNLMISNYSRTEMMDVLKDGYRIALPYIVVKLQVQNIFSCV
jgi:hypothetical protein